MSNAVAKTFGVVLMFLGLLATLAYLCSRPEAPQSAIVTIAGLIGAVGAGLVPWILGKQGDNGEKRGGGPGGVGAVLLAGMTSFAAHGCAPAKAPEAPREYARAAVLMTSNALAIADQTCAALALETRDQPLANKCATAYKIVRASLVSAASAVDTWDSLAASRITVTCAVEDAARNLDAFVTTIRGSGGRGLDAVDDAIKFASSLGKCGDTRDVPAYTDTGNPHAIDGGGDQ